MQPIYMYLLNLSKKIIVLFLVGFLAFSVAIPTQVNAQNSGVIAFKECDIKAASAGSSGPALFQNCVKSVLRFIFILGLFLIIFRIGYASFTNLNPTSDTKAVKDSITAINEIAIGLILIGLPWLIITTVSPSAGDLSFLNLGKIGNSITSIKLSPSGGTGGGTGGTNGGNNTSGGTNNSGTKTSTITVNGKTRTAIAVKDLGTDCKDNKNKTACDEAKALYTSYVNCLDISSVDIFYDSQCESIFGTGTTIGTTSISTEDTALTKELDYLQNILDGIEPFPVENSNIITGPNKLASNLKITSTPFYNTTNNGLSFVYYITFAKEGASVQSNYTTRLEGTDCGAVNPKLSFDSTGAITNKTGDKFDIGTSWTSTSSCTVSKPF